MGKYHHLYVPVELWEIVKLQAKSRNPNIPATKQVMSILSLWGNGICALIPYETLDRLNNKSRPVGRPPADVTPETPTPKIDNIKLKDIILIIYCKDHWVNSNDDERDFELAPGLLNALMVFMCCEMTHFRQMIKDLTWEEDHFRELTPEETARKDKALAYFGRLMAEFKEEERLRPNAFLATVRGQTQRDIDRIRDTIEEKRKEEREWMMQRNARQSS